MIECTKLSRVFRTSRGEVRGLDGVDLQVPSGEWVCVRGPSGCGKTTLLLVLGGMLRPSAGSTKVAGEDIYARTSKQRARFRATKVGFVFQMFHLVPYLNVLENVLLAADTPSRAHATEARDLIEKLGLGPRSHHRPGELSAGERQRTAIARALLNRPKLILADEPTGNLDPENADEVFRHLDDYRRGGGTVLVVTHGHDADRFANRVLMMKEGRLLPP